MHSEYIQKRKIYSNASKCTKNPTPILYPSNTDLCTDFVGIINAIAYQLLLIVQTRAWPRSNGETILYWSTLDNVSLSHWFLSSTGTIQYNQHNIIKKHQNTSKYI